VVAIPFAAFILTRLRNQDLAWHVIIQLTSCEYNNILTHLLFSSSLHRKTPKIHARIPPATTKSSPNSNRAKRSSSDFYYLAVNYMRGHDLVSFTLSGERSFNFVAEG
jgi:hypothetical protein